MSLSQEERDRQDEELAIAQLVVSVREHDSEQCFLKLQKYLEFYVKLFGSKYRIPGHDSDEIEQECLYALRYKAIEDFNPKRGKFKSFAILCIRRHLFSIIKGSNQQKRRVLNESLSLHEDRSEEGENLSLINLVVKEARPADEEIVRSEGIEDKRAKLLAKLSRLEREVFKLYIQQYHYDEIVEELRKMFPEKNINKKSIDNSLVRSRQKAQLLAKTLDFD